MSATVFSQETATLCVLNGNSKTPLAGAGVWLRAADGSYEKKAITNLGGCVTYESGHFPVIASVSFVGFRSVTDTLRSPVSFTIRMQPAPRELNDVVVTGQSLPQSVSKSVYDVQVINATELRQKGANNLREALQTELNIDLANDQVFGSSLSVNGVSGEGVKILVDGVPVVGRVDGKLDLSQLSLLNVERIEIVKGPLSVQYGTDAVGGVINIITRNNEPQRWRLGLKGYFESVGQYNAEALAQFRLGNHQLFINGSRNFFDGYSPSDTFERFTEWKPREQYNAAMKYTLNGNNWRLTLNTAFFTELMLNRSEPRLSLDFEADTSWTWRGDDLHTRTWRPRVSVGFDNSFFKYDRLESLLSYSGFLRTIRRYEKNLVTGSEVPVPDGSEHDTAHYHLGNWRTVYHLPSRNAKYMLQLGTDFTYEAARQNRISGGWQQAQEYAVFASLSARPAEWINIQPAFRTGYNSRFKKVLLVPSLHFKLDPINRIQIRFGYGRGYRAPSLKEMYLQFFDINHAMQGNPNLQPEKSNHFNFSIAAKAVDEPVRLKLENGFFLNQVFSKIDWTMREGRGPELDTFVYTNLKDYLAYGPNAAVTFQWRTILLQAQFQYTWYRVTATDESSTQRHHSADVTATARFLIPYVFFYTNATYKFNGSKLLYSANNSVQSGVRAAYHTFDISFSKNFWKERIEVTIGGKNLLDVRDVAATGLSAVGHNAGSNSVNANWGRSIFLSLAFNYAK